MSRGSLWITGDPAVDGVVNTDPLALLIGMLLDQQIPIEWAFAGPARLRDRLGVAQGERLDPEAIAALDPDRFVELCRERPALHRYPAAFAGRIQDLCTHVADRYDGRAERLWQRRRAATTVHRNLVGVPGFGDEKARILIAVLAKRFGVVPAGWQEVSAPFGDDLPRSVADMGDEAGHAAVRAWRLQQKAAGKGKAD